MSLLGLNSQSSGRIASAYSMTLHLLRWQKANSHDRAKDKTWKISRGLINFDRDQLSRVLSFVVVATLWTRLKRTGQDSKKILNGRGKVLAFSPYLCSSIIIITKDTWLPEWESTSLKTRLKSSSPTLNQGFLSDCLQALFCFAWTSHCYQI